MDAERAVLEQERITAFRQRNDESREPTKWASDTCASAGVPRGLRACNPIGGWGIGGKVSGDLMSTEPITRTTINRNLIRSGLF